jgi:TPR repeat protein
MKKYCPFNRKLMKTISAKKFCKRFSKKISLVCFFLSLPQVSALAMLCGSDRWIEDDHGRTSTVLSQRMDREQIEELFKSAKKGIIEDLVRLRHLADEEGTPLWVSVKLGLMYKDGQGVAKDEVEAVRLFRSTAEKGYAPAEDNLAGMYVQGLGGVPKDEIEAVRLFKSAAEKGYASAQFNLGTMCQSGRGVERNKSDAMYWYRLAAEQGNAGAHDALRRLSLNSKK